MVLPCPHICTILSCLNNQRALSLWLVKDNTFAQPITFQLFMDLLVLHSTTVASPKLQNHTIIEHLFLIAT